MSLEGVLNIDKPPGITSHDVVNRLRRISAIRRIGHAGTLDPLATGVLLLCVGRATRLSEYLVGQPKNYIATVRLGQVTDSYDAEGEIVSEQEVSVSRSDIMDALDPFRGYIQQRAPIYSAIKQGGQPLYKLAREGKHVDAPLREVQIYNLELLSWEKPLVKVQVTCSAGTYIRSIAHDLGQNLGCGGHISALRRTAIGDYKVQQAVALDDLNAQNWTNYLQPSDTAVYHLSRLDLSAQEAQRLQLGQRIQRLAEHPDVDIVRAYEPGPRFIGIVISHNSEWKPHKMFLTNS